MSAFHCICHFCISTSASWCRIFRSRIFSAPMALREILLAHVDFVRRRAYNRRQYISPLLIRIQEWCGSGSLSLGVLARRQSLGAPRSVPRRPWQPITQRRHPLSNYYQKSFFRRWRAASHCSGSFQLTALYDAHSYAIINDVHGPVVSIRLHGSRSCVT